jgi:excisionase family DNA binding protein
VDPFNVSVEEAARLLGIGVTSTKQLIREGKLLSYRDKRRRLVPVSAIREYQAERLEAARAEIQAARAEDASLRYLAARARGRAAGR